MNGGLVIEGGVTGVVLAGGRARRLGGDDKGLIEVANKPLIVWTLERLQAQVAVIGINANRHHHQYHQFGYRVFSDVIAGFAGPLAGIHAGLCFAKTEWVLTVPCDSPFFPIDLLTRLSLVVRANNHYDIAVARVENRPQPVFMLLKKSLASSIVDFFEAGGDGKIDRWYAPLKVIAVDFELKSDFSNINTPQDLDLANKRLSEV